MTDYTKLVAALRECARDDADCRNNCPYYNHDVCTDDLKSDAADAIEALQAEVTQLQKEVEFSESSYDEFSMQAAVQNALLAGKLPKQGKWVGVSPMVDTVQCSVCGGQLFSAELETPYCPYCGAKMEVQE
jgi:hypothetical protein